jgi:hypothetical protein
LDSRVTRGGVLRVTLLSLVDRLRLTADRSDLRTGLLLRTDERSGGRVVRLLLFRFPWFADRLLLLERTVDSFGVLTFFSFSLKVLFCLILLLRLFSLLSTRLFLSLDLRWANDEVLIAVTVAKTSNPASSFVFIVFMTLRFKFD